MGEIEDGARLSVVLDAGPAVHQRAGLSRYTERLASYLLTTQSDCIDLALFYNAHSGHQLPSSLQRTPHHTVRLAQLPWRLTALATQLLHLPIDNRILQPSGLPVLQSSSPPALHSSTHIYHATEHLLPHLRCPTILTVHDLIFERYPEHHTRRNRLFLKMAMPIFVRAADTIIAVSQHTKRDLMELYGTPTEKIHVVYEGIEPEFIPATAEEVARVRQVYSPDRPYLLMVGTLEPRKNHAAAMRALARLRAAGFAHRLLIAGGHGWLFDPIQQQVAQLGLENDVSFAGYVPAADLPALYSGADCLLQPSLYEGFGFPPLEAMACGTPVICSSVSSLPEVAGDAALLTPPQDDDALTAAIQRVLTEPGLADTMRAKGIEQSGHFTWQTCAAQTVAVYETTRRRK